MLNLPQELVNKIILFPKKKLIKIFLALIFFVFLVFPYIDANIFYPARAKQRIEILEMVTSLDIKKINENSQLKAEYEDILTNISNSKDRYLSNIFNIGTKKHIFWKFISGGILWWIFSIVLFFGISEMRTKEEKWYFRIYGFLIFFLIGICFGIISALLPILGNPLINYFGVPATIVFSIWFFLFYMLKIKKN